MENRRITQSEIIGKAGVTFCLFSILFVFARNSVSVGVIMKEHRRRTKPLGESE